MTIPLNDDTKATFLNILRELRKSLPNSGADDVAAIMYLHDRMTESDQGRTLTAYVEAAHADPVAVRFGPWTFQAPADEAAAMELTDKFKLTDAGVKAIISNASPHKIIRE